MAFTADEVSFPEPATVFLADGKRFMGVAAAAATIVPAGGGIAVSSGVTSAALRALLGCVKPVSGRAGEEDRGGGRGTEGEGKGGRDLVKYRKRGSGRRRKANISCVCVRCVYSRTGVYASA